MSSSHAPAGREPINLAAALQQRHLQLHSVDIFVRDQERSVRFYIDQLGFQIAFDARLQSGQRWIGVSPPDGSAVLTLIQPEPDSPNYGLIGRATRIIFVTEDVTATYREWSERGVRFRHTPRLRRIKYEKHMAAAASQRNLFGEPESGPVWGEVFTRFEDIDRNSFALVSFDEVNQAIQAQRRAMAEKLEAERRMRYELDIARQVQARLFPQTLPASRTLEYAGYCSQARQVGGDYYDFLSFGDERLGLLIGDVAGKGIAAALLMANLQAQVRSQYASALHDPQRLLRSVNQLFHANTTPNAYATLFFAEYDDGLRRLRYINCGHLPGLVSRRNSAVQRLGSTATVLGMFEDWDCSLAECQLDPGDVVAFYTDGIVESFNAAGEEFGEERVVGSLERHRELGPEAMIAAILADAERFRSQEPHDDITLIIAKCS